ncbi:MAG: hypothetical protein CVT64_01700 [Actinobacteria bacterium HGW-Actinobacteria-4]|nr:MAG: hypothetical protein CVT64_01700 [Actinobacteria bacterium HGW-Actinobacteria-4]
MRVVGGQDFGAIVRQRRLDQGIKQEELAQRVGRTRQWLSRLERGVGDVSLADALRAARELGLVVDVSRPSPLPISPPPPAATQALRTARDAALRVTLRESRGNDS